MQGPRQGLLGEQRTPPPRHLARPAPAAAVTWPLRGAPWPQRRLWFAVQTTKAPATAHAARTAPDAARVPPPGGAAGPAENQTSPATSLLGVPEAGAVTDTLSRPRTSPNRKVTLRA